MKLVRHLYLSPLSSLALSIFVCFFTFELAAQDGVFLGKEEDEMLLLVGGGFVHVAPVSFLEWRIHKLETNVARVFKTPLGMWEGRGEREREKQEEARI